jgi:hypothetical protein
VNAFTPKPGSRVVLPAARAMEAGVLTLQVGGVAGGVFANGWLDAFIER